MGKRYLSVDDIGGDVYKPALNIVSQSVDIVQISSTSQIILSGEFLDYATSATITPQGSGSATVSILSKSFSELVLEVTVDSVIDTYDIALIAFEESVDLPLSIQSANINIVVPLVSGTAPALWVKSGTNNQAIVTDGGFECQNTTGNGWNEHAYFGSFSPASQIEFLLTIDRLIGASNAYCFWKFDNTNTPTTTGNPRLYFSVGTNLTVYNSTGASQALGSVSVGDNIKVRINATSMEVFKNGVSIYSHNGTYNLTNIYSTFTGYRVFKAINIQAQFD